MPAAVPELRRGTRKVVIRFIDTLLRDTVASWVDSLPGYRMAGAVAGSAALLDLCQLQTPDVAVVQLGSAESTELALLSALCGVRPIPHVVGLHPALDPVSLLRLHRAGASRLVSTRLGLPALRAALGEPGVPQQTATDPGRLSRREREILGLIAAGHSVRDVAAALAISAHTVTNHKRHIFAKLNVHSRAQAAAEASRLGLLADRVVVMGPQPDARAAVADAISGGAGAVLADTDVAELLPAVHSLVRAGYLVAAEDAVRTLLAGRGTGPPPSLTRRERDILASVALGHSVRETAQALGITIKTVQSEQRQLFSKLGARNRLGALSRATELGLVPN